MKLQIFLFSAFSALTMSCATSIPYSNEESCAIENLKFLGLEKHEVVNVTRTQSEHVPMVKQQNLLVTKCEAPRTNAEKQEIQYLKAELEPKIQFNQSFWKSYADQSHALAASNGITGATHPPMQATFPKDE